jgi:uncharacterized protein (TIGR03000 family)
MAPAVAPAAPPQGEPLKVEPKKATQLDSVDSRAHLVVTLPEKAKLYVDENLMKSGATRRSFVTPELQPGSAYYYDVRVEVERDGKPVTQSKRIVVRAGQNIEASFVNMAQEATAVADAGIER